MRRAGALLTAVGVLAAGAAGCSTVADEAVDAAAGEDVDVDTGGGEVSIDTGDGEITAESTAEIPAVISELVPVPDEFVAERTQDVTDDDFEGTQVRGKIDVDDPAAVLDDIEQALAADGFETLTNASTGGESFTLMMSGQDGTIVNVQIITAFGDEGDPADMNIVVMR